MHSDLNKILNEHDSELFYQGVREATKVDFESIAGDFNRIISSPLIPMDQKRGKIIKFQWQLVGLMSRTIIHLMKKNASMEADYRGRNR